MKNLPLEIEWDDESLIVYLDEVGALGAKGRDTRLLKPIDEWPCVWIASAVSVTQRSWVGKKKQMTKGLSDAVRARFAVKVGTELPGARELTRWIKKKCHEWQILIEEPELTIPLLMKRAQHRIGYVKQPIAVAASRGESLETRRLTIEDVGSFYFEAEE